MTYSASMQVWRGDSVANSANSPWRSTRASRAGRHPPSTTDAQTPDLAIALELQSWQVRILLGRDQRSRD